MFVILGLSCFFMLLGDVFFLGSGLFPLFPFACFLVYFVYSMCAFLCHFQVLLIHFSFYHSKQKKKKKKRRKKEEKEKRKHGSLLLIFLFNIVGLSFHVISETFIKKIH